MDKIKKVIQVAEKFLKENPYDEGHDLDHHKQVWKNAQIIAKNISELVDLEALHVSSMWHDVVTVVINNRNFKNREMITLQTSKYLEELMLNLKFSKNFINKVIIAVKEHDLNSRPKTIEGKILYDADKLEFLSLNRWKKILNALKTGKMAKVKLFLYKKFGKKWLSRLRKMYNFDYSRQIHDKKVKNLIKNKEAQIISLELGENLSKILNS